MLIQHREITHPDVTALVLAAEDELFTRYPGTTRSPLDPHARFVVAYVLGRPVGCGALVVSSPGVGEIRRMYVLPAHRRAGVARRILAALERRATAQGWDSIILETGVNQPEAIALYESSGFQRTEPYGRYVDNPYSVCFVKKLLRS
ncbi:GNAT family N-acetyltransferase [Catellatospora sichuanensis]|uniref:GNAT family N-acetyltransferase n=1 Tax=Catellatospora sichuanensis TaxID=1969805 RepID=UPI001642F212|nr:GNAT family N-acetyltransferase [Catellatospora sichuanensis]